MNFGLKKNIFVVFIDFFILMKRGFVQVGSDFCRVEWRWFRFKELVLFIMVVILVFFFSFILLLKKNLLKNNVDDFDQCLDSILFFFNVLLYMNF